MKGNRKRRAFRAAGVLLGLGALCALVVFVLRPPCLILRLTGFFCPGCGGQRMLLALLRGDVAQAFRQNPLLFFLLPLAAVYMGAEAVRYVWEKPPLYRKKLFPVLLTCVLAVTVLFAVLRNLPGFGYLGPA